MTAPEAASPTVTAARASWREVLLVYLQRRVLVVLLLGFSAGLPFSLAGQTLQAWVTESGVDLKTIGLFAFVGTPYWTKVFWSPAVDALDIPVLTRWLGRRRAWLLLTQVMLLAAIVLLAHCDPQSSPLVVAFAALLVTTASATQDIVIDAFRVESLQENEQAAGMASYVAAYRIAALVSGAGALLLVSAFVKYGFDQQKAYSATYIAMAVLIVVGMLATLLGGFAGGIVARSFPLSTSLWIGGILQAVAILPFSWQAIVGNNAAWLTFAITAEQFTAGLGTVTFVAYLSALCGNPLHTATQYALLTALTALGRTVFAAGSGYLAEATGWFGYFLVCAALAIPSFVLLAYLQRRGHFETLGSPKN